MVAPRLASKRSFFSSVSAFTLNITIGYYLHGESAIQNFLRKAIQYSRCAQSHGLCVFKHPWSFVHQMVACCIQHTFSASVSTFYINLILVLQYLKPILTSGHSFAPTVFMTVCVPLCGDKWLRWAIVLSARGDPQNGHHTFLWNTNQQSTTS